MEEEPEWRVPQRNEHLHMMHIPPRVGEEERARCVVKEDRGRREFSIPAASAHAGTGESGAGSGRTEQIFGGQARTAGPLPQLFAIGNTAQKAANQEAPGHQESSAGEGDDHEVIQAEGYGSAGGVHAVPLSQGARNLRALQAM